MYKINLNMMKHKNKRNNHINPKPYIGYVYKLVWPIIILLHDYDTCQLMPKV